MTFSVDTDLRNSLSSTIFRFMGRENVRRLRQYALRIQRGEQVTDYDILCDIHGVPPELQDAFDHFQVIKNKILSGGDGN